MESSFVGCCMWALQLPLGSNVHWKEIQKSSTACTTAAGTEVLSLVFYRLQTLDCLLPSHYKKNN